MKFAIVCSKFNPDVTTGLTQGAMDYLSEQGIGKSEIDLYTAPGAFELPLIAQSLAQTRRYAGVICLGCVIKGETAHFEYISLASTMGILQASLQAHLPITFGVLTAYNEEQALARSRKNDPENKGREAAKAAYETAFTLKQIGSTV